MLFINNEYDKHVFITVGDDVFCANLTIEDDDILIDYVFHYEQTDKPVSDDILEIISKKLENSRGDIIG